MAALSMFQEVSTGNSLPVQFDIMAAPGQHHADRFHPMFVPKAGEVRRTVVSAPGGRRAILTPEKLLGVS